VNDSNKQHIVDCGALPYYVKIMQSNHTVVEQAEAAHGIWTLAFNEKCKETILKEDGCLEGALTLTYYIHTDIQYNCVSTYTIVQHTLHSH